VLEYFAVRCETVTELNIPSWEAFQPGSYPGHGAVINEPPGLVNAVGSRII